MAKNRKMPIRRKFWTRAGIPKEVLPTREEIEAEVLLQLRNGKSLKDATQAGVALYFSRKSDVRLANTRAQKEAMVAARLARNAARDDPAKRAREAAAYAEREKKWAHARALREREAKRVAEKRARDLEANPTLKWRKPRRKGWTPDAGYATGGKRKNKKRAGDS